MLLLPSSFPNTLGLSLPHTSRLAKGNWAVHLIAKSGLGLSAQGQHAQPGQPLSPLPGPLWGWLENTKADPMQDIMCKRRRGRSFCSLLQPQPHRGGGGRRQRSECAKVLGRRVSSPSREGGRLLSLSLGKAVSERGAETEG